MVKVVNTSRTLKKLDPLNVAEAFGAKVPQQVIIASTNPVKIAVAEEAFRLVFPEGTFSFTGIETDSGVRSQPFGEETRRGAQNRLERVMRLHPDAHYFVSQEGGLFDEGEVMYNRAWIMVADNARHRGESSTASFVIPHEIARLVRTGLELGDASDVYYGTKNLKHHGGGISFIADGLINRQSYYLQAAILALCQVKNHHLYR